MQNGDGALGSARQPSNREDFNDAGFPRFSLVIVCVASTLTAFVVGGVAWAVQSPVDGGGVIHACYAPKTGAVSLDVKGACPIKGKSTPITWNAKGQPGLPGPTGAQGATDPNVGRVSVYRTQSSTGGPTAADTRTGPSLGVGLDLSSVTTERAPNESRRALFVCPRPHNSEE